MKVAVEGCCHGELDAIYSHIAQLETRHGYKVDVLLICGDFQAMRNFEDLHVMAAPIKYREIKDFHKYYSGAKKAPMLTLVIGGNHEASNYLWELYHGGWLAPNIYFLGHAGSVLLNGIRISGSSGIFKGHDFRLGHHEHLPYNRGEERSIYHTREYCIRKLSLLPSPNIFLSHDWPHKIEQYGNLRQLLAHKKYLKPDIDSGRLGSPPLMGLLQNLRPQWWFAAHLHTRFEATVPHFDATMSGAIPTVVNPEEIMIEDEEVQPETNTILRNPEEITLSDEEDNVAAPPPAPKPVPPPAAPSSVTNFLALNKCLPNRQFLEVVDIATDPALTSETPTLAYDPIWLAITRAFHPHLSLTPMQAVFPDEAMARAMVERELEWVQKNIPPKLDNGWAVNECQTFSMTAPPLHPKEDGRIPANTPQPKLYNSPQTEAFCQMLEIQNKINTTGITPILNLSSEVS